MTIHNNVTAPLESGSATVAAENTRQRLRELLGNRKSQQNSLPDVAQPDVAALLEMIQRQADDISDLTRRLILLEAKQPLMLAGGRLPSLSELSKLEVQIFYRPELAITRHKRKTEWSLRLTAWIGGRRAKPDINVALYPGSQFYRQAMSALSKRYVQMRAENLSQVIEEAIALTRTSITDTGLTLGIQIEQSGLQVEIDKVQIQQVLFNLLRNAIEAMQEWPKRELAVVTGGDQRCGYRPRPAR
jgi:signal transduction histidine kinase